MNIKKIRKMLLAASLCAALPCDAMASGLQAQLSTTQVPVGESFSLVLSVNSANPQSPPDLSPLKKHFQILGVSQQSQTSIINGQRSETFSWVVSLMPNDKGTLTIPALTAGSQFSDPLTIEVVEGTATAPGTGSASGDVKVELSVGPGEHYVQQEIPITLRIHDGVGLREARLREPSGNDFVLTQTGEDQIRNVTQNGKPGRIIERRYFLKAQKSGQITIPPLTLVATVDGPPGRSSVFSNMGFPSGFPGGFPSGFPGGFGRSMFDGMFDRGREISVRSQPVTLEVKPRPTGDAVWFLPAKEVELRAQWAQAKPQFKVGEAVTRTIQLYALGASKEQLPDIPMVNPAGARLYLERTNDKSVDTPEGTAAIREFVVSLVPTQAGEVALPAIEVRWWDTGSDSEKVATLPAQTISVAAGPAGASQPVVAQTPASNPAAASVQASKPVVAPTRGLTTAQRVATTVAALLFLTGAGVATRTWMARRRRGAAQDMRQHPAPTGQSANARRHRVEIAQLERVFTKACHANDLRAAYSALTAWLRKVRAEAIPTARQAPASSFELMRELATMEEQLYAAKAGSAWDPARVLAVFNKEKRVLAKACSPREARELVPALYPRTGGSSAPFATVLR